MRTMYVAMASLLVLAACGGGTATGPAGAPLQIASQTGVVTSGTITAFGSVYVNGVRYDVSAANLHKNGQVVAQSALAVGEVAVVNGHQDLQSGQGSAVSVEVEDNVVGPIATINASGGQLSVLGQTINVTASTSFSKTITPADLTGLKVGDSIEVSGLADATGAIAATRIGRAGANESLQVLGTVAGLTAASHTFTINGLNVDFTSATLVGFASGPPNNGQPSNGDSVVVRAGTFDATTSTLVAAAVALAGTEPSELANNGGRVEQEGLVTRFASATDFDVAGSKVTTTSTTQFKGGTVVDLVLNARVEVRGTLDANKVLVADVVSIHHVSAIALASTVAAVDAANSALTMLGLAVTVDANTRFEDKSSAEVQLFTLKDIAVGDTLAVRGYESPVGSGKVLATRVERLPVAAGNIVLIRGSFTATTAPMFAILGVTVDTTSATFGTDHDQPAMTSADFFAKAVGQIVEVAGTATGSTIVAAVVRIESESDR